MRILIVGSPSFNKVFKLEEFLKEGQINHVEERYVDISGVAAKASILLADWNIKTYLNSAISQDYYGVNIKEMLKNPNLNLNYLETNYKEDSEIEYTFINNGKATIIKNNKVIKLSRYKYEFIPDLIVLDGSDVPTSLAVLNSFSSVKSILYLNSTNKEQVSLIKHVNLVITKEFVTNELSRGTLNINRSKHVISYMQKLRDHRKSNFIIVLDNYDILYVDNNQVKLLNKTKMENVVNNINYDSAFLAGFIYSLVRKFTLEKAVKMSNYIANRATEFLIFKSADLNLKEVFDALGYNDEDVKIEEKEKTDKTAHESIEQLG